MSALDKIKRIESNELVLFGWIMFIHATNNDRVL